MRLTDFWARMEAHFGPAYARSWAHDFQLAALGGRTCDEAIIAGMATVDIWRAVWTHERLPLAER
ncbi:MAG: DUF3046 domain-containing protein [Candidatus Nanopelagicales bacterium]